MLAGCSAGLLSARQYSRAARCILQATSESASLGRATSSSGACAQLLADSRSLARCASSRACSRVSSRARCAPVPSPSTDARQRAKSAGSARGSPLAGWLPRQVQRQDQCRPRDHGDGLLCEKGGRTPHGLWMFLDSRPKEQPKSGGQQVEPIKYLSARDAPTAPGPGVGPTLRQCNFLSCLRCGPTGPATASWLLGGVSGSAASSQWRERERESSEERAARARALVARVNSARALPNLAESASVRAQRRPVEPALNAQQERPKTRRAPEARSTTRPTISERARSKPTEGLTKANETRWLGACATV